MITGFAPAESYDNASGSLVESMASRPPDELAPHFSDLRFCVIEYKAETYVDEQRRMSAQLKHHLAAVEPDACLHFDQAPGYAYFEIEGIATNSFIREAIDLRRPAAYWANLPGIGGLQQALEEAGHPVKYSSYAGQHLYNHILFSSLDIANPQAMALKADLVHIPILPEQVVDEFADFPSMSMEAMRRGVTSIIQHVYRA